MAESRDSLAAAELEIEQAIKRGALGRLREIIYQTGERKHRELGDKVLQVAQTLDDEGILENAAWALGETRASSCPAPAYTLAS